ncbi:MAG: archaellin/type IV pilin N-terminal domain-containing protein [Candidatus Pacearchaeota archaeon]|jgi:hypothetical protein
MNKSKKAVSQVVTTVLIILIAVVAVGLIWAAVNLFMGNFKKTTTGIISNGKFEIQPLTEQDINFDRFRLKNTGQVLLTEYEVKIDGVQKRLIVQKRIAPQEDEYLYIAEPYQSGEHDLFVKSLGYTQNVKISVPEAWHLVISNVTVQ